jgi:hypothetical protein
MPPTWNRKEFATTRILLSKNGIFIRELKIKQIKEFRKLLTPSNRKRR